MNKLWNRVMNFGTGSEFLLFFFVVFQICSQASKIHTYISLAYSRCSESGVFAVQSGDGSRPFTAVAIGPGTVVRINKRWCRGVVWSLVIPVLHSL